MPETREEAMKFDVDNMYRQDTFVDFHFGAIQRLTPVTPDGEPDATRPTLYSGSATVMTQAGPLPVQCEIEAASLKEAAEKLPAAVEESLKDMIDRARAYERERAVGIVVPPPGTRLELP